MCVPLSPFVNSDPLDGFEWIFVHIILGPIRTDYWNENRKIENRKKSENLKIWNFQNRKISKPGPNHGANQRPKGEPVAVGDLKESWIKKLKEFKVRLKTRIESKTKLELIGAKDLECPTMTTSLYDIALLFICSNRKLHTYLLETWYSVFCGVKLQTLIQNCPLDFLKGCSRQY